MNVERRFNINISCASCINRIKKILKKYNDIEFKVNILENIIIIKSDENKYNDIFLIDLFKKSGYYIERID